MDPEGEVLTGMFPPHRAIAPIKLWESLAGHKYRQEKTSTTFSKVGLGSKRYFPATVIVLFV